MKKIRPEELPKTTVYFPELHPGISSFLNLTTSEIDAKLKLGALCNGKILIGSSHLTNPLAFSYLKTHPKILKKGIISPYLNVNFKSFDDYFNYKEKDVYQYLRDSFKKLGKHYTKEEHKKLYFDNQSTEEIANFLEENTNEIVIYRPDICASNFNDVIVREVEDLKFKYGTYSHELNEIKNVIENLGYLGDPVMICKVATSRFYKLPTYISNDLNRIVHRTYGYGGISEFNTGLYTDSSYFVDYKDTLQKLMEIYDIREEILEKILYKKFNKLEIDTISWDDIFDLLKQEQVIRKLHKGIENVKKQSVNGIKQDIKDDCRNYLNELDEIINPIIEDKIFKEKKFDWVQKGVDVLEKRNIEWALFIALGSRGGEYLCLIGRG